MTTIIPWEFFEAAGTEGMRVHDLRHSFATLTPQGGISVHDISKRIDRSDASVTQRFAHMLYDSLQNAMVNMTGGIDQVAKGY